MSLRDRSRFDPDARARWNRLKSECRETSPFSQPEFVEGLANALQWDVVPVFADYSDHSAAALLITRRSGPLKQIVVPPFAPYSALLIPSSLPSETGEHLLNALLAEVHQVCGDATVILRPDHGTPLTFETIPLRSPWSVETYWTYRSPVTPTDDAIMQFSSSTRRAFRKHRADFSLREGVDQIDAIVNLAAQSYHRHGRRLPVAPQRLSDLARRLVTSSLGSVVAVRRKSTGRTEAGVVLLRSESTAWYWIAGSIPGPAMTVCISHLFDHLAAQGLSTFDFMGANTPSIAEFKRRFGGTRIPYRSYYSGTGLIYRVVNRLKCFADAISGK